jgi:hypothetical protein
MMDWKPMRKGWEPQLYGLAMMQTFPYRGWPWAPDPHNATYVQRHISSVLLKILPPCCRFPTATLLQNILPHLCSKILYRSFAPKYSTAALLDLFLPQLCSTVFYRTFPLLFSTATLLYCFLPQLCSTVFYRTFFSLFW